MDETKVIEDLPLKWSEIGCSLQTTDGLHKDSIGDERRLNPHTIMCIVIHVSHILKVKLKCL